MNAPDKALSAAEVLPSIAGRRLAVVGDAMLDHFVWGSVERISPEAPVPVVRVREETWKLGGAANVAAGIRALGADAVFFGLCGRDEAAATLRRLLGERGIDPDGLVTDPDRPTTLKTRIIAHHQQVCRTDREHDGAIDAAGLAALLGGLRGSGPFDGIVLSDYGKGVLTEASLPALIAAAREAGVPVVIDPKRGDYAKYRGATALTPNQREAELACGHAITDQDSLRRAGHKLLEVTAADALLITRGEHGMALYLRGGGEHHLPAVATTVYDVTGAGDTVIAVYSSCLAAGASHFEAARLANHAAGLAVRELGTAAVTLEQLRAVLPGSGIR
jgi:D-beta-D-heptose 7-phosphate kinase/D-beta-D-heptose 1-phosphate adenosyltransferase